MNPYAKAIETVLMQNAYRATVYVKPGFVVKATRRHKIRKNDRTREFVVTFGAPNYRERAYIAKHKTFPRGYIEVQWHATKAPKP